MKEEGYRLNVGIMVANSVGELVKNVDVIITCLPSPKICSEVMLNEKSCGKIFNVLLCIL